MSVADVVVIYGIPDAKVRKQLSGKVIVFDEGETSEEFLVCNPFDEEAVKQVIWDHLFLEFTFFDKVGNSSKDPQQMKNVFAKVSYFLEGIHLIASDLKNSGLPLLSNFLHNEKYFAKAKSGKQLFGQFQNKPAIICGAGPSLEGARDELKRLSEGALIFAGGTALASLGQWNVKPHFAAHIDPHQPAQHSFHNKFCDLPTFFQSRAHPTLLEQVKGPLLWMPGSAHDFFDDDEFDGGWNVATFLTAIAYYMGCNPIILVGVDCAQKGGKTYAAVESEEDIELVDLGNGQFTRKDWLMAGRWLTEFAQKNSSVEWVRVPGGLELEGFVQKSLSEIHFSNIEGVAKVVEALPKQASSVCQGSDVRKSLANIGKLCDEMLKQVEAHFPYFPKRTGPYILCETEMEQEMAYRRFLTPIWKAFLPMIKRQLPPFLPEEQGLLMNQWLFMKRICDEARAL